MSLGGSLGAGGIPRFLWELVVDQDGEELELQIEIDTEI